MGFPFGLLDSIVTNEGLYNVHRSDRTSDFPGGDVLVLTYFQMITCEMKCKPVYFLRSVMYRSHSGESDSFAECLSVLSDAFATSFFYSSCALILIAKRNIGGETS